MDPNYEQPFDPGSSGQPGTGMEESKDARTFAALAHLLGIFTSFVGPLVIWIIQKDVHPFVDDQAKEALNFHITILLAHAIAGLLWMAFCIGTILTPTIFVLQIVLGIMATVKANNGERYRYPLTLRLLK